MSLSIQGFGRSGAKGFLNIQYPIIRAVLLFLLQPTLRCQQALATVCHWPCATGRVPLATVCQQALASNGQGLITSHGVWQGWQGAQRP